MELSIKRIYGTSSNTQLNVSVSGNLIAYIASGGVVVSSIDKENGQLTNQRFLCANNNNASPLQAPAYNFQHQSSENEKDQYGTPKPQQTVQIEDHPQIGDLSLNSPVAKSFSQSQKIKTISCVAISPDERFLAIGESGTQPRILIFSLAPDSNDFPILSIVEHNFGVIAVRFSKDSRYLLSIGDTHDGFIYIWRFNGLNLDIVGANKCTSQINGVYWIDDIIITFGVRHIKIWKFEENEKKSMLQGKSVILGECINSNFVYCCKGFEAENDFLFLSSIGEIYGYDLATNTLKLRYIYDTEKLGVLLIDGDTLWIGGDKLHPIAIEKLRNDLSKQFDGNLDSPTKVKYTPRIASIEKINQKYFIYTTSNEQILLHNIETSEESPLIDSLSKNVSGIKVAANGQVINWTRDGVLKIIEHETLNLLDYIKIEIPEVPNKVIENHITSLEMTAQNEIIAGDSYGNLSIFNVIGQRELTFAAHEFSINDICYFEVDEIEFLVSTGRDRMIQVYAKTSKEGIEDVTSSWSIFQTLDEHKGNLLKLITNDNKIYVSSADRTISIHKFSVQDNKVLITKERLISLKSTPSTIALYNDDLFVCGMDKNITIYNLLTLESTRGFKLFDNDNESLLVDAAAITPKGQLVCSCTDKSVRVFNYITAKQISVNWGHSEPIKFLVLVSPNEVITLSSSGCLFSWYLKGETEVSKTTIQKYNDINTPQKVTRKIKKQPSTLTLKRTTSPVARTPTTTRLQSTAKLTPSRLNSSTKPNLSPRLANTSTFSSPVLLKTSRTTPKGTPTPKPKYSGAPLPTTAKSITNENKPKVDELIGNLRSFKANLDSYSLEEVTLVKKEIKEIFQYEEELLQSYNALILNSIAQMNR